MQAERKARRVALVSGKGGVGKTMVAANLAAALAKSGHAVLVIDSDLGLANLDVMLGVQPSHTLHEVLHGSCTLKDALVRVPISSHGAANVGAGEKPALVAGFDILPGGSGIVEATTLTAAGQDDLKKLLHELDSLYEFLLFDAGAGIGEVVLFFAQIADDIVLVVTPEPTSVTDAYATMKVLARECGRTEFHAIVNQVSGATPDPAGAAVVLHLQQVASRFLLSAGSSPVGIHLLGVIPSDPTVPRAIARQQLLESAAPGGPATRSMALLAKRLSGIAAKTPLPHA